MKVVGGWVRMWGSQSLRGLPLAHRIPTPAPAGGAGGGGGQRLFDRNAAAVSTVDRGRHPPRRVRRRPAAASSGSGGCGCGGSPGWRGAQEGGLLLPVTGGLHRDGRAGHAPSGVPADPTVPCEGAAVPHRGTVGGSGDGRDDSGGGGGNEAGHWRPQGGRTAATEADARRSPRWLQGWSKRVEGAGGARREGSPHAWTAFGCTYAQRRRAPVPRGWALCCLFFW